MWIWHAYWLPYAFAITHRHPLSHTPIVGTVLRLLYLAPGYLLLTYIIGSQLLGLDWPIYPNLGYLGYVLIGLMLSDTLHWVRDKGSKKRYGRSKSKRRRKSRRMEDR
ncbi:MAG: DUF2227 family putative metal-binding protein [Gammaproteobacteria bacterium]|nr:DUF2227 family putative metal-binding protein [Gammaproteobacteria bacterium]